MFNFKLFTINILRFWCNVYFQENKTLKICYIFKYFKLYPNMFCNYMKKIISEIIWNNLY